MYLLTNTDLWTKMVLWHHDIANFLILFWFFFSDIILQSKFFKEKVFFILDLFEKIFRKKEKDL